MNRIFRSERSMADGNITLDMSVKTENNDLTSDTGAASSRENSEEEDFNGHVDQRSSDEDDSELTRQALPPTCFVAVKEEPISEDDEDEDGDSFTETLPDICFVAVKEEGSCDDQEGGDLARSSVEDISKKQGVMKKRRKRYTVFPCDQCDYKSAKSPADLLRHQAIHKGERGQFACDQCDYRSFWLNGLKMHMLKHTGKKRHKCPKCSFTTIYSGSFKYHLGTHEEGKEYSCHLCQFKAQGDRDQLKEHLTSAHAHQKGFACDLCEYRSFYARNLRRHKLVVHESIRPHVCDHCKYRAIDAYTLKIHSAKHLTKKPYPCSKCDYTAHAAHLLRKHERRHLTGKFVSTRCIRKEGLSSVEKSRGSS